MASTSFDIVEVSHFNILLYFARLRINDEDPIAEMRIWYISLIKFGDFKMVYPF